MKTVSKGQLEKGGEKEDDETTKIDDDKKNEEEEEDVVGDDDINLEKTTASMINTTRAHTKQQTKYSPAA